MRMFHPCPKGLVRGLSPWSPASIIMWWWQSGLLSHIKDSQLRNTYAIQQLKVWEYYNGLLKQNSSNQEASFDTMRVLRMKLWRTSTKILIIIALTTNISCTITKDEVWGPFYLANDRFLLKGRKLSKTIFTYLKDLFSFISAFQFPVSGFCFLYPDSSFRFWVPFLSFRFAPFLTLCLLYIQFTHGCCTA